MPKFDPNAPIEPVKFDPNAEITPASEAPSAPAPRQDGFWASAAAPFIGAVKGLDPRPTEDERKRGLTSAYDYAVRPLERVAEGGIDQGKQAVSEFKQAAPLSLHPTREQLEHRQKALGHGMAAALPILGPWAAQVGEEEGEKLAARDYEGAAGTAVGNLALAAAPKVAAKTVELAPRVSGKLTHALTDTGPDVAKGLAEKTEKANTAKEGKVATLNTRRAEVDAERITKANAANDAALKEHEKTVAEADKKLRDAHVKHQAEKAEVENTNKAAAAIPDARTGLETYAKDLTEQADVRIEKARHDALVEGNGKYSTVNEQLNPLKATPKFLGNSLLDASEKIKGSNTSVPILKDMETRLKTGGVVTYENLQGYYSELGREIVKGTLPGDVYHALDTLHETIGNEMQRIADSQGLGTELKSAREYWRRMKQTFGDTSDVISDRAGKELKDKNPDYIGGQVSEYRQRLLGSFDPQIPNLLESAAKARERLGKLPSEESARKMIAEVPRAPEAAEVPPPATKPVPDPRQPLPFEKKTISAEDLTKANRESLAAKEKHARTGYSPLVTSISIFDAMRNAMEGNWKRVGMDVAARGAYEVGKQGFAAVLRNKSVIDFLSKPTAEQIAQIPADLRGPSLKALMDTAKGQGIKVDPRLYVVAALGASQLAPRKNPTDEWAGTSQ
jgi:hypothetical protein